MSFWIGECDKCVFVSELELAPKSEDICPNDGTKLIWSRYHEEPPSEEDYKKHLVLNDQDET